MRLWIGLHHTYDGGHQPVVLAASARAVAYGPVFGKLVEVAGCDIVHHVDDVA